MRLRLSSPDAPESAEHELEALDEETRWAFWAVEVFPGGPRELIEHYGHNRAVALTRLHKSARERCNAAGIIMREHWYEASDDDFYEPAPVTAADPFGELSAGQASE